MAEQATEKEMAAAAANELFKSTIKEVFEVLDSNLISAHDAAAKQAVIDRAKAGLAQARATRSICLDLANALT